MNQILSIGDVETLKNSIQTRYIARIIYELFATPDSILLLGPYGLRLLDLCEKRRIIFAECSFFYLEIVSVDLN